MVPILRKHCRSFGYGIAVTVRRDATIWLYASLVFALTSGRAFSLDCVGPSMNRSSIQGYGEGHAFVQAKAAATADAMAIFGTNINSRTTLIDDSTNLPEVETYISSHIEVFAQAVQVVHKCEKQGHVQVWVELVRPTFQRLLEDRGLRRQERCDVIIASLRKRSKTSPNLPSRTLKVEFDNLISDENHDRDMWTIASLPQGSFREIPPSIRKSIEYQLNNANQLTRKVILRTQGSLALSTLPKLRQRLADSNFIIANSGDEALPVGQVGNAQIAVWRCQLDLGVAMGTAVRFAAQCSLDGLLDAVNDISVSGMAQNGGAEDSAARMIGEAMQRQRSEKGAK